MIDEHTRVRVLSIDGERVKIGIEAPKHITVLRESIDLESSCLMQRAVFEFLSRGGLEPAQFKWLVFDGRAWTVVRDWSEETSLAWTPR